MGARWYDPGTAGFTARDTVFGQLQTPVTLNRYTYANNDPMEYFDPDGRFASVLRRLVSRASAAARGARAGGRGTSSSSTTARTSAVQTVWSWITTVRRVEATHYAFVDYDFDRGERKIVYRDPATTDPIRGILDSARTCRDTGFGSIGDERVPDRLLSQLSRVDRMCVAYQELDREIPDGLRRRYEPKDPAAVSALKMGLLFGMPAALLGCVGAASVLGAAVCGAAAGAFLSWGSHAMEGDYSVNRDDALAALWGGTAGAGAAAASKLLTASRTAAAARATTTATEEVPALSRVERVGSALKDDPFHRSASWVVDEPAAQRFAITGGDGVQRTLYQLPGEVNGKPGVFEWVLDTSGGQPVINHQRFIPGGQVTGVPNQVP